jgi:hypothetical protein
MSTITVEKLRLTGALQVPVLTQAQINALSPEQGQIVYNSDINYIQIYGPFDNWGLTDIGTGNDLWDIENQTNNGTNSMIFKPLVSRGEMEGPDAQQMGSSYMNSAGAWAGNQRFMYQSGYQGYQTVAIPKDGLYRVEIGGARGGKCSNRGVTIMYGASATGDFYLSKDQRITMVVGVGGGDYSSPHGNEAGGGGGTWVYDQTNNNLLMVAGGAGGSAGNTWGTNCTRDTNIGRGQSSLGVSGFTCNYSVSAPSNGDGGNANGNYHGGAGGGYNSDGAGGGTHCSTAGGGQGYSNGLVGGLGNTCYTTGGLANSGGFGGGGGGMLSGPGGAGGYTGGCTAGQWSSYSTHGGGGGSYNGATTNNSISAGGNQNSSGGYNGAGYVIMTWISE